MHPTTRCLAPSDCPVGHSHFRLFVERGIRGDEESMLLGKLCWLLAHSRSCSPLLRGLKHVRYCVRVEFLDHFLRYRSLVGFRISTPWIGSLTNWTTRS